VTDRGRLALFIGGFGAAIVFELLVAAGLVSRRRQWHWRLERLARSRTIVGLAVALAVVQFGALGYGLLVEPFRLDITHHVVVLPTMASDAVPIRLVHVTDLHFERHGSIVPGLAEAINGQHPDLVVLTGDYLNDVRGAPALKAFLQALRPTCGVYAVKGNFDHRGVALKTFAETNATMLCNDVARVTIAGTTLDLFGTTPWPERGLSALPRRPDPAVPSLLLTHYPYWIEPAANENFDLVLCGHTHGGQVRLPWFGAVVTRSKVGKRYEAGYYRVGRTQVYVGRGVGLEPLPAPPVRFLCRPEMTLLELHGQKAR